MQLRDTEQHRSGRRAWRHRHALGVLAAAGGLTAAVAGGQAIPAASAAAAAATAAAAPAAQAGETVIGWGDNSLGELGDGTTTSTSKPVFAVTPPENSFTSVRTSGTSLALTASRLVFGWGNNSSGQIGDGTTTSSLAPVRTLTPTGVKVTAVRESGLFSLALTSTGKVLAWGNNSTGGLGDGTTRNRLTPVQAKIPKGVTITAISAGDHSALALTKSGRVLAWGENAEGQLGNGTTRSRLKPVYVRLLANTKVTSIAAGLETGYAVTSSGRLLAWGLNSAGQLGDGTTKNRKLPVQVRLPRGVRVTAATAGQLHVLALTRGGGALAWGSNHFGQLGTGSTASRHVPVRVKLPKGTMVRALAAGADYSMALTADGRILTWGHGNVGQLGNGATADRHAPVRVHLPFGFTPISIGAGLASQSALAIGHEVI